MQSTYGASGLCLGTPEYVRVSRFKQALHLDDPGVRLRLVAEVRNDASAPVWLRHLNADPAVLLPLKPVSRFSHGREYRLGDADAHLTPVCSFG
jgi:hypothetical protein